MATTATNKQPLLVDRVLHNVVESNSLTSGSASSLDILGTNQSAVLVDCTTNDGAIIEDLYTISRTATDVTYTALFYLSTAVDYLRPGEGIYIGKVDSAAVGGDITRAPLPNVLAPTPKTGSDAQFQGLYVPKGKVLWVTLQSSGPISSGDTPIIGAQGGYY